jgi:hypothetical protein
MDHVRCEQWQNALPMSFLAQISFFATIVFVVVVCFFVLGLSLFLFRCITVAAVCAEPEATSDR